MVPTLSSVSSSISPNDGPSGIYVPADLVNKIDGNIDELTIVDLKEWRKDIMSTGNLCILSPLISTAGNNKLMEEEAAMMDESNLILNSSTLVAIDDDNYSMNPERFSLLSNDDDIINVLDDDTVMMEEQFNSQMIVTHVATTSSTSNNFIDHNEEQTPVMSTSRSTSSAIDNSLEPFLDNIINEVIMMDDEKAVRMDESNLIKKTSSSNFSTEVVKRLKSSIDSLEPFRPSSSSSSSSVIIIWPDRIVCFGPCYYYNNPQ